MPLNPSLIQLKMMIFLQLSMQVKAVPVDARRFPMEMCAKSKWQNDSAFSTMPSTHKSSSSFLSPVMLTLDHSPDELASYGCAVLLLLRVCLDGDDVFLNEVLLWGPVAEEAGQTILAGHLGGQTPCSRRQGGMKGNTNHCSVAWHQKKESKSGVKADDGWMKEKKPVENESSKIKGKTALMHITTCKKLGQYCKLQDQVKT